MANGTAKITTRTVKYDDSFGCRQLNTFFVVRYATIGSDLPGLQTFVSEVQARAFCREYCLTII